MRTLLAWITLPCRCPLPLPRTEARRTAGPEHREREICLIRLTSTAAETIDALLRGWLGLERPDSSPNGSGELAHSLDRTFASSRVRLEPRIAPRPVRGRPKSLTQVGSATGTRASPYRDSVRRGLNVVLAAGLIFLTLPVMILTALAVRLSSPGPVLFTQPRVGLDRRRDSPDLPVDPRRKVDHGGRVFRIYKFRTMVHQPEGEGRQVWARPGDPRITPVGRILRRYRLDELPQLFNVLKGDMNLVGPRPEQPEIFKSLRDVIHDYPRRQRVRPGITGLAQVNRAYDRTLDDVRRKLEWDLAYVEQESPAEDLRILLKTVPVVFLGKGAV
jgi:lipopolysaccharide/colanic/teichoic acid biosynthesis glycosyltransferase